MTAALHVFMPPSEQPGAPTVWRPIEAYLDQLALRVEADGLSRDNYLNHRRNLTRWGQAWSVVLPGGRHILVPQWEDRRNFSLTYSAKDPAEAIKAAEKIAAKLPAALRLAGGEPIVRLNGQRLLSEASQDDLRLWLLANPQWKSGHTKTNNLNSILDCYRWFAEEYDVKCPFKRKKVPRFLKEKRREATDWEYVALMRHSALVPAAKLPADRRVEVLAAMRAARDRVHAAIHRRPLQDPARLVEVRAAIAAWQELQARLLAARELVRVRGSTRELRRALWSLRNVAGIRTCEMRGMLLTDFQWSKGLISTYAHKTARATGKPRDVALTLRQYWWFRNLERQHPPWPANVLLNTDGKAWTRRSFALHLRRTAERIGLDEEAIKKVSGYCFRHTYATQAREAGVATEDAASLCGHTPEIFNQVYDHTQEKIEHRRQKAQEVEDGRRKARRKKPKEQGWLFDDVKPDHVVKPPDPE